MQEKMNEMLRASKADQRVEKKLQVRDLRISFRTTGGKLQAVRDISFDLHKGETLAIVGESGSGKSVTSKAVLGILAGNSIVEGGEILYDGQDLLKISEDDFYRLRGDKIAMIFQDPLSSLNPIMRIGKQLTEAMLLKGRARQRSCRNNFKTKLKLLRERMLACSSVDALKVNQQCETFRAQLMKYTELAQPYAEAYEYAEEALYEINNLLFLIGKNAFSDKADLRQATDYAMHTCNPYVVPQDQFMSVKALVQGVRSGDLKLLGDLKNILEAAVAKTKPDFYAMAYYVRYGDGSEPAGTRSTWLRMSWMSSRRTLPRPSLSPIASMTRSARMLSMSSIPPMMSSRTAPWTPSRPALPICAAW